MGLNRQRKPRLSQGRGLARSAKVSSGVLHGKQVPSVITDSGRDLIIDVLQHAASGGSVPVSERHFDSSAGTRITFHRNIPLSPIEIFQRVFEGLGFPQDLVMQYITDLEQHSQMPAFANGAELLAEDSVHQTFLVDSCFNLFSCMTLFSRAEDNGNLAVEQAEDILDEEMDTIRSLFNDSMVSEKNFLDTDVDDREIWFKFLSQDGQSILVAIRIPDYYPSDPPSLFLQPHKGGTNPVFLSVSPFCTRELPATVRRQIMDMAVETINGLRGAGCLLALVSAVSGMLGSIAVDVPRAPVPDQCATRNNQERHNIAAQRKAFMGALTGKNVVTEDTDGESSFVQVSMPGRVLMQTIEEATDVGEQVRSKFLACNLALNASLKEAWRNLQSHGSCTSIRSELPAFRVRAQLKEALHFHNAVVISGDTGSGKTTQIPQYVYEFMCEEERGSAANIVCTQPRRLAATSVALRVAEERDEAVGGTVGYSIRLENCTSRRTQIIYCTTGILLRRLQTDKFLGKVSHVIVDEIHERSVDTDFLLILLRDLLSKRSDLKVILMSATMDSELFARYFGGAPIIHIEGRAFPVKVMHLEEIIPILHYNLEDDSPYAKPFESQETRSRNTRKGGLSLDMGETAGDIQQLKQQKELAKKVCASAATLNTIARMDLDVINYELIELIIQHINSSLRIPGAVLVFLPGLADIQRCLEQLQSNERLRQVCLFFNLHSSLGSFEQQSVFKRPPAGKRKVILGTNIMETSITIDDAVFVIDTGKAKENRYNAQKSLSELVTVNISKANCRQRQGRAGRVREGFCFRLFTEAQFEAFSDHQLCEMHRVPLESLVLQIYALHLGNEVDYLRKALTPPEEKAVQSSVKVLTTLGALTAEKRLTSLGRHLSNLPLDVRVGKMIIHGAILQCLDPVLTIAASLATRSPFITSIDFRSEVEAIRRGFAGESASDQLCSWYAYQRWVSALVQDGSAAAQKVCTQAYLSPGTLLQIQSTKIQYERYLYEAGFMDSDAGPKRKLSNTKFVFPSYITLDSQVYEAGGDKYNTNSSSVRCILACLMAGLYPNVARVKQIATQRNDCKSHQPRFVTFDGSECLIHPSSVAGKASNTPSGLVVYVDKIKTSATFLREVSFVAPLHVILFCGRALEYLPRYEELCVDEMTAFRCNSVDAALLSHLKDQLDSALTIKINNPTQSWESISSLVVRAIVRLLKDGGSHIPTLTIIDRRQSRVPLTATLLPQEKESNLSGQAANTALLVQPFRTSTCCFVCGETGHMLRHCPHAIAQKKGGPSVRCFICGQWHFPPDCALVLPLKR